MRTEQDIMKNWRYQSPPLVSVLCITYNHEKYIKEALEGFLMQETNFPFEIIIGDDHSSDSTLTILKQYAKLYPNIIQVLNTDENLGIHKNFQRVVSAAQGVFIAFCEGDDYWSCSDKLAEQHQTIENHPGCSLVFHAIDYLDTVNNIVINCHRSCNSSRIVTSEEIIAGGGSFIGTQSIFFRRQILLLPPDFLYLAPAIDYPLFLLAILRGKVFYLDRVMAIYRTNISNSAVGKFRSYNLRMIFKHAYENYLMLVQFNSTSNYKFTKLVHSKISKNFYNGLVGKLNSTDLGLRLWYVKKSWKHMTRKHFIFSIIACFMPTPFNFILSRIAK